MKWRDIDLFSALCNWFVGKEKIAFITAILGVSIFVPFVVHAHTLTLSPSKAIDTSQRNTGAVSNVTHETATDLTLRDAINLALLQNPELAAFGKEMRALEGATLQAGLLKNPELVANVENAGNIQKLPADINSAEGVAQEVVQQLVTIRLYQLIELGGKRAARTDAALIGEELAGRDYEAKRIEIIARVAGVFIEVLAAQERLRLAEETQRVAQSVVTTVSGRVQGGKVAPIEETRVKIGLSTTRIEQEQAQRDLIGARKRLALLWNSVTPHFNKALGNLDSVIVPPDLHALEERVLANPLALRAVKNVEHRQALLKVEQTKRIPNMVVSGGGVHHAQLGGTTATASIAIPLPLFDRNQGAIKEAYQRIDKAVDEQAATELRLKTELAQAYEMLLASWNEITILRDEIIPGAKSTFSVMRRGYELGKFGLLELLDSQRVLFQNQVLYVRALANYQRLVNDIERLIAAPIDSVKASRNALSLPK